MPDKINDNKPKIDHSLQKKAKINGAINTLSRLQTQLMYVGISNAEYNDISEMIGNVKDRLSNIEF
jgi:hypothetical protein